MKFKRRKNAAVKKLEGEQQNLLRVNDILNELTNQLGPLRRQSEAAHIYLLKRDNLRDLDINLYLLDSESIEKRISELAEKEEAVGKELAEARQAFEETRQEYDDLEKEIEEIDLQIASSRQSGSDMALRRQELKGQIEILREQIRTVRANDEHFDSRRAAIAAEIEKRQKDLETETAKAEAESKLATANTEKATLQARIAELEAIVNKLPKQDPPAGGSDTTQGKGGEESFEDWYAQQGYVQEAKAMLGR